MAKFRMLTKPQRPTEKLSQQLSKDIYDGMSLSELDGIPGDAEFYFHYNYYDNDIKIVQQRIEIE